MTDTLTRTVEVEDLPDDAAAAGVAESLAALDGVTGVEIDRPKGRVTVTYDPRRVRLDGLESRLVELGLSLKGGTLARLRRNWRHFTEANETDILKSDPHCCNKPPK